MPPRRKRKRRSHASTRSSKKSRGSEMALRGKVSRLKSLQGSWSASRGSVEMTQ